MDLKTKNKISILIFLLLIIESLGIEFLPFPYANECGKASEVSGDERTRSPWSAAIFTRKDDRSPYVFFISGAIISNSTVISLFGGAYGALPRTSKIKGTKYSLFHPKNIIIVTGINSTSLSSRGPESQIHYVSHIVPHMDEDVENREYHFFLLHLKTKIDFTAPFARPICLPPPFTAYLDPYEKESAVSGFGTPKLPGGSFPLKFFQVITGPEDECKRASNFYYGTKGSHIVCFQIRKDEIRKNSTCILHGGLLHWNYGTQNQWFLWGLVALIPRRNNGQCNSQTMFFAGNLFKQLNWIYRNLECGSEKFTCSDGTCIELSKVCDNQRHCPDNSDEESIFCEATNKCKLSKVSHREEDPVRFRDHHCSLMGTCVSRQKVCDGVKDCENGSDEVHCEAVSEKSGVHSKEEIDDVSLSVVRGQRCNPIQISEGVLVTCTYTEGEQNGKPIECKSAFEGVRVHLKCKEFYVSKFKYNSIKMTCGSDGLWMPFRTFACVPECGIIESSIKPFVTHGHVQSRKRFFPWYAAVYFLEDGTYKFQCGASLIEKSALLTAAHCVTSPDGFMEKENKFKVVLSPLNSNYYLNVYHDLIQTFEVKKIYIPATYNHRSLRSDIAIIHLKSPATFTNHVRPVCYLPQKSFRINANLTGKVAGFGLDETNKLSLTLKYIDLPVVESNVCRENLGMTIPPNTFCAGNLNGKSVCQGDSGGGIVFTEKYRSHQRYYIRGIVSQGREDQMKCSLKNYTVFTHVDNFIDWILDILERLES